MNRRSDGFYVGRIYFDGGRSTEHLYGDYQSTEILFLANHNSIDSCERPGFYPDRVAVDQERMRFQGIVAFYCAANGINLFTRDKRRNARYGNYGTDARRTDDWQLSIGGILHKKVSRKQWQR